MTRPSEKPGTSELILYQSEDGKTKIEVRLEDETVWLSQRMMADLFQKDVRTINEHNEQPRRKRTGYPGELLFGSPQAAGN